MKTKKSIQLCWYVVLLVFGAVVPLVIFAIILVGQEIERQKKTVARGMRETAHSFARR